MKKITSFLTVILFSFFVLFPGYQSQESDAKKLLQEGKQAYQEGNFDLAIEKIVRASQELKDKEDILDALITLSFIYFSQGDEAQAEIYFQDALKKDPRIKLNADEYGPNFLEFSDKVKSNNLRQVIFKINPEGELYIDNNFYGKGAEISVLLIGGNHRLEVVNKGYEIFLQDFIVDRNGQTVDVVLKSKSRGEEPVIKPEPARTETEQPANVIEKEGVKKTRKRFPVALLIGGIIIIGIILFLVLTKKSQTKLTVTMMAGVNGTPTGGTYTYKKTDSVSYSYSLQTGYTNLSVKLDGNPVGASGTITMDRNHTLEATAVKLGTVDSVTVKFTLTFAGENLKTTHNVKVNNTAYINEQLGFKQHYNASHLWDQLQKINRSFSVTINASSFAIRHEVMSSYSFYYSGEDIWIGSTKYQLTVTDYTYRNGPDPGRPTLSESSFFLNVAPWKNDANDEWYRIKNKTITINGNFTLGKTDDKPSQAKTSPKAGN